MADANKDAILALTGFDNEKEVPLPVSGVTLKLEIPGAADMVAAHAYMKENSENDLKVCSYIMRHHCLFPNFKDMDDVALDDLVGDMHYQDVAAIILAFFMGVDLQKEEDRDKLEQVFREMGQADRSQSLLESSDSL